MSMNFAREQSLLRQRLAGKAVPGAALPPTDGETFLGAPPAEIDAAAEALGAAWPQMGRAQMTAFVRTLWNSKIHELRAVGVRLLAARAALLEPADLPLLESFLRDSGSEDLRRRLAGDVIGSIVQRNKKLWRDLKRFTADATLRLAGVRAAARALANDGEAFPRYAELVEPLLAVADDSLQKAIDDVMAGAAELHRDAVVAFAVRHGRSVALPKVRAKKAAVPALSAPTGKRPVAKASASKPAVKLAPAKAPKKSARAKAR